jgi:hypothetical protein
MNPLKLLTPNRRRVIIAKLRKQDEAEPKGYDLCLKVNDGYIDIIATHSVDNPTKWRLMVIGITLAVNVSSRKECIDILEKL